MESTRSKVANPKRRLQIGPIKRDDKTFAVRDDEKANLINAYFATVGTEISRNPTYAQEDAGNDDTPI